LASNILRRAGRLVDEGAAVWQGLTVSGSFVGAVYGEMTSTIMRSDGDPSASRWRMGAGREALLVRYHIGHGTVRRATRCSLRSPARTGTSGAVVPDPDEGTGRLALLRLDEGAKDRIDTRLIPPSLPPKPCEDVPI
jgi:hypothetical protein